MGNADSTPKPGRYTVSEAADMLGITTGAVRNRLSRGTLRKVKEGGTVYVLLPADMSRDTTDTPPGIPHGESDALTSELRDRLHYVEAQLDQERQAHAEARRIIAGLVERIPAIEAPTDAPGSPETAEREPERGTPRPDAPGAQEGVRRPWWRRVFGGRTVMRRLP